MIIGWDGAEMNGCRFQETAAAVSQQVQSDVLIASGLQRFGEGFPHAGFQEVLHFSRGEFNAGQGKSGGRLVVADSEFFETKLANGFFGPFKQAS